MKELSIEQKAKAYDEAYKRAAIRFGSNVADELFPELKESEDEKIRKALIRFHKSTIDVDGIKGEDILAWLEKQCKQKPNKIEPKFKFGDIISNGNVVYRVDNIVKNAIGQDCYFLVNIEFEKKGIRYIIHTDSQGNHSYIGEITWLCEQVDKSFEKQGEQKPDESEIPLLVKFKQAVYNCAWEKVTCKSEGETQEEYAERWAEQLLSIVRDWADDYVDSKEDAIRRRAYDKAVKEQKPDWSEEDEKYLKHAIENFQMLGNSFLTAWLKSLKDRVHLQPKPEWSDEDERIIDRLCDILYDCHSYGKCSLKLNEYSNLYDWLKSLKDRILPKSAEWSEEDEKMIDNIIDYMKPMPIFFESTKGESGKEYTQKFVKNAINWLKSFRPQNRWKPSDEQIGTLKEAIIYVESCESNFKGNGHILETLLEQLKKLMEE